MSHNSSNDKRVTADLTDLTLSKETLRKLEQSHGNASGAVAGGEAKAFSTPPPCTWYCPQ